MKDIFVTAIGTDSGKSLISSILVEALQADYWKPIQAGNPRDTDFVKSLISNETSAFHKESYHLELPASPHAAAKHENMELSLSQIQRPITSNQLVIEGAGGIMVPLNSNDYVIDIAKNLEVEIILVSNLYLGSINHTLLSIEYLKYQKLPIKGLIFNGESNIESERIIQEKSPWPCLLKVPKLVQVTKTEVKNLASLITWN